MKKALYSVNLRKNADGSGAPVGPLGVTGTSILDAIQKAQASVKDDAGAVLPSMVTNVNFQSFVDLD